MTASPLRVVIADDEPLSRERLRRLINAERDLQLVGEADDGKKAVALIRRHQPEIVVLDVRVPVLNAFEVLAELGKQKPPAVIFVTAHPEYAVPAFEARVVDYLLKPLVASRFHEALRRARSRCTVNSLSLLPRLVANRAARPTRIALKSGLASALVAFDEILYVTAANNYCEVFAVGESVRVNESLGSLEARLPGDRFFRISRSALVNLGRVTTLEAKSHGDLTLLIDNKWRLTVARTRRNELLARLNSTVLDQDGKPATQPATTLSTGGFHD